MAIYYCVEITPSKVPTAAAVSSIADWEFGEESEEPLKDNHNGLEDDNETADGFLIDPHENGVSRQPQFLWVTSDQFFGIVILVQDKLMSVPDPLTF